MDHRIGTKRKLAMPTLSDLCIRAIAANDVIVESQTFRSRCVGARRQPSTNLKQELFRGITQRLRLLGLRSFRKTIRQSEPS